MDFFFLKKNIQLLVVGFLDIKSIFNFSLCSKQSLELIESSMKMDCLQHKYWIYFVSCNLKSPIINKSWRCKKWHLDKFYDRWYLRAYKRNIDDFNFLKEIGE